MTAKPLIIFGAGEIAEVAAFYFGHDGGHNNGGRPVAAFTIDDDRVGAATFAGLPVVPLSEVATRFPASGYDAFVGVGYAKINALRQTKCLALQAQGYRLASYVSTRATVFPSSTGGTTWGWNAFILEDNTVQPFVKIGNGVTLWSGNHIGHHAVIGDFAFVSSHVVISGGVTIGERTFIGVNSTLNDHITVGQRCVIGSGCLITKDVADEGVLTAEPAKLSPVPSRRLKGF
jgi:sugar O-acyltransferase (sialic acid O-acetyltransferase NeuD family)